MPHIILNKRSVVTPASSMLPHSDCSNCDAIYIKVPSSETRCVNIQLQLLHLLVAGLVGRGRMVIARKSPAALTTLLVRRKKDI